MAKTTGESMYLREWVPQEDKSDGVCLRLYPRRRWYSGGESHDSNHLATIYPPLRNRGGVDII
jgi:hypothetical protein